MRIVFSIFLVIPFILTVEGQELNGSIIDQQGKWVLGAHILNVTNGVHTHTDESGRFRLKEVQLGDRLEFSHIGYEVVDTVIASFSSPMTVILYKKSVSLNEVVISPRMDALDLMTDIDIQVDPVNSSQEILRSVPGLFIGQHAGGGKAEQIFLRGFDVDHGTDISISVDGMPVNMVSHAHGQGYADLHFVIPETVDRIDFGKGAYYSEIGNFNTAGFVDFKTKSDLDGSLLKIEGGQFDSKRMLGMFDVLDTKAHSAYIAAEYTATDGPFESPQDFSRLNVMAKYKGMVSDRDRVGLTLSHFTSAWDASGQIPQRAVDSGQISRFGAIDDTEGGTTSRSNVILSHDRFLDSHSFIENTVYYSAYDFNLFSNFTFFLEDPVNGDQIEQKEGREIFGVNSTYHSTFKGWLDGQWEAGMLLRNDQVTDVALSRTLNRKEILERIQFGDVTETNIGAFADAEFDLGRWTINPGLRVDQFDFRYLDALQSTYSPQSNSASVVSPKFNVLFNYSPTSQLYLKTGKGFHSNDTRVVIANTTTDILPASYGADIGWIWKPAPRLFVNAAFWYLSLEQEFVYVGDAGIVEPSGATERQGVDLSIRYQPLDWMFWSIDATYTDARSVEAIEGEDLIPLAPRFTMTTELSIVHESGAYGGIDLRMIGDRPANEDDSIIATGYSIVDLNAGYAWEKVSIGMNIKNLFDAEWNETQFATESRLQDEPTSVEEIHFTPGTPFFLKGVVEYRF